LTFTLITIFYLFTRWLIFNGFNGTDDLHYAFLAASAVKHQYNAFLPNEILSGRILLITFQSIIYRVAGINTITTQLGTLFVTVLSCWLTVFKILKYHDPIPVIVASSLFYFNPVLTNASIGIMPDPYIMLVGICVVLILKNIILKTPGKFKQTSAFFLGQLIGLSLLIKEISILFLPFCFIFFLIYRQERYVRLILWMFFGFATIVLIAGSFYYTTTGDVFFKIHQINNSNFPNSCSDLIGGKALLARMTYKVWQAFFVQGFYPAIIAFAILIVQLFQKRKLFQKAHFDTIAFIVLLMLGLYFPFSLMQYKPVCAESRHFLFLLPWAVVVVMKFLYPKILSSQKKYTMFWIFVFLLIASVFSTYNKWQWMIYLLLTVIFLFEPLMKNGSALFSICFSLIMWLSLTENFFLRNNSWWKEMQTLNNMLPVGNFYFADDDNLMHWELLRKFNLTDNTVFNLKSNPIKAFAYYYPKLEDHSFKPGWFILNKYYTVLPQKFSQSLDSLKGIKLFSRTIQFPHVEGLYIENVKQLNIIRNLAEIN